MNAKQEDVRVCPEPGGKVRRLKLGQILRKWAPGGPGKRPPHLPYRIPRLKETK